MNIELLTKLPVFKDIEARELEDLLKKIRSREAFFERGEQVFSQGDIIHEIGVVLAGELNGIGVDLVGHANIVAHLSAPDIFGEAYANMREPMLISIVAQTPAHILFIDVDAMRKVNHAKLNENILMLIAMKNLQLSRKILMITPKSISERILSYLSPQAALWHSDEFDIPFDRQQLADYLLVDRSALSHSLSVLKRDGIIDYHKNHFKVFVRD